MSATFHSGGVSCQVGAAPSVWALPAETWPITALEGVIHLGMMPDDPYRREEWQAKKPTAEARVAALNVVHSLCEQLGLSLPVPRVIPTLDLGVELEFRSGHRELQLEFLKDGRTIDFLQVEGAPVKESSIRADDFAAIRDLVVWLKAA